MSAISWAEGTPSDASAASLVDDEFQSMVTAMSIGLGESFFWAGSAASQGASTASSGELRPGSARLMIAEDTRPLGDKPNGFLGMDENNSFLYHLGSGRSDWIGSGDMQSRNGGLDTAPFTTRWLVQTGSVDASVDGETPATSDRTILVTFGTAYNGVPDVMVGPTVNAYFMQYGIRKVGTSGFTILQRMLNTSGVTPNAQYIWRSEGTVNL